jgi:hypothetical protein
MKRILFLALFLTAGMVSFAQVQSRKAPQLKKGTADIKTLSQGKEVGEAYSFTNREAMPSTSNRYDSFEEFEAITTTFDLQTNGYVANRMVQWEDGTIAVTATFSHSGTAAAPDRGTGYNYYDGSSFGAMPEARIEAEKTGWPVIAQYGENGEIVVAHTGTRLTYYIRENKGVGEWQGPHYIPNPSLGGTAEEMTWAKVGTSGPNHDIIHVVAAAQDGDSFESYIYYAKSTDGVNWTVNYMPAMGDDYLGAFSADHYAIATNGNNVAVLFTGSVTASTYIIKSTDNGETWAKEMIWENPYDGFDWETDPNSIYTDTLYAPENGAIAIDNNGTTHVALSIHEILHDALGTSYSYFSGLGVDGIMYWNETMGQMVSSDGNPHHVCRLWWPDPENPGYVTRIPGDYFIGYLPDGTNWSNDNFYNEDYSHYFQGLSVQPTLTVDESGSIAVAYSCPDLVRQPDGNNKYYRSIYVSYFDGFNWYAAEDYLQQDFIHMLDECINTTSIQNSKNNEFWISYSADPLTGFGIGNYATQGEINENTVWAVKVVPNPQGWNVAESINPMTNVKVYPNPAVETLNIEINASQASDVKVAIFNITGQKVIEENLSALSTGINARQISVSNLTSGVYFVTVKANGFEETQKFVVK